MASKETGLLDDFAEKMNKNGNKCVAYGCCNRKNDEVKVKQFPVDIERRKNL